MSTNTLPDLRPLDPVIEDRILYVQNSLFQATGTLETLRVALDAHHCDFIADRAIAVIDLLNTVQLALDKLNDVGDRIDTTNLRDPSRRRVVRSESTEEVPDAA